MTAAAVTIRDYHDQDCQQVVAVVGHEGVKYLRLNVQARNASARAFYSQSGFQDSLILMEKAV